MRVYFILLYLKYNNVYFHFFKDQFLYLPFLAITNPLRALPCR